MVVLRFCISILLSQIFIVVAASASDVTRVFSCPCHVRVNRVIDGTGISDSEAFDIRVRSLNGDETHNSFLQQNIKLDDSTHQDAFVHHFKPMVIAEHGLFKVSITHKSSMIGSAAHTPPSYMLTKTSFAWRSACPILIPYDIPQVSFGGSSSRRPSTRTAAAVASSSPAPEIATPNIVGGLLSESSLRRYLVALVTVVQCRDGSFRCRGFCSGTLIDGEWIISAAHCKLKAGSTRVHVNTAQSEKGAFAIVTEVFYHPGYVDKNFNTSYNDVVVAKLNVNVVEACARTPGVCGEHLPKVMQVNRQESNGVKGEYLRTAGFGKTSYDERVSDRKLRQVDAPVANFKECRSAYLALREPALLRNKFQICVGYEIGRCDSCQGDSGGPVLSYDSSGAPVLIGVTSIGVGCGYLPGAAVRISGHIAWLHSVGVPLKTYSSPLPVVGPQCKPGEYILRQPGVGICARCPMSTFSIPPTIVCLRCPFNTLQEPGRGDRCGCKRYADLAVTGRGRLMMCVRCEKGFVTSVGSNRCRRVMASSTPSPSPSPSDEAVVHSPIASPLE